MGNNTPVFFVRDPLRFQHFIRSQKRRADSGLRDHDMQWDFWTLSPESAHQVTWLVGGRGIPKTRRHMNGYSSHTYLWVNAKGERFWVKNHFKTDQGIEFLTQEEADRIAGQDSEYHRRDLFEAGVSEPVLARAFDYWRKIDPETGDRGSEARTASPARGIPCRCVASSSPVCLGPGAPPVSCGSHWPARPGGRPPRTGGPRSDPGAHTWLPPESVQWDPCTLLTIPPPDPPSVRVGSRIAGNSLLDAGVVHVAHMHGLPGQLG